MKTNTNNSELKSRSEQLSTAKTSLAPINFARRRVNHSLDTDSLIRLLRTRSPGFFAFAEVVGRWVWIQFPEKQPVEVTSRLAQLGFHWNNTRQAWQHPCGVYLPRCDIGSVNGSPISVNGQARNSAGVSQPLFY